MKHTLRIFALITALLLALPTIGCLVKKDSSESSDPVPTGEVAAPDGLHPEETAPETDEPVPEPAEFDADAIAIELGDIRITAGEVQDTFDQYVSMFAYGYGLDEETIGQFMGMTEESLIEFYMPQWKAQQVGITLSAEDEARIKKEADASTEEERNAILIMFAEAYAGLEEEIEDASELTDNQLVVTLDAIHEELAEMFGEDYTFDDYLEMRRKSYADELRSDRYSELLREYVSASVLSDTEEIDAQYEAALATQKANFDEDPAFYLACQNGDNAEDDFSVCLYVPAESARLQVIRVRAEESDDRIAETKDRMQALEAEYGALALNGENEARQAEIEAEYAGLAEQLATMEADLSNAAKDRIDAAYAELSGGKSFEDAMNAYNEPDEDGSSLLTFVILTGEADPDYPELTEAVASLAPGAYSEPIKIDDAYYIVQLVERIPAGVIDRASIEESFREMLLKTATADDAWQEQLDAWYTEATEAAVYHRETYEMITDVYLSYYE